MILASQIKFQTGQIVITPNALEQIPADDILNALNRHVAGDWGDLDPHDRLENELSLQNGLRLLSAYHTAAGIKFWIITEASRAVTTVLMPKDY
jgi:hypothetical protein